MINARDPFDVLDQAEVRLIHEAALEILETVGLFCPHQGAREIMAAKGARVEGPMIHFPRSLVEDSLALVPPTYRLHGRQERYDRSLPDDAPIIVTGSSAPSVIDPVTLESRPSTAEDIARIAFLFNELPGFDFFSISVLADEAPADRYSVSRFYPALKNCAKPIRSNTPNLHETREVVRLGEAIAGNERKYRERPFIHHSLCPIISPLAFDQHTTDSLIFLTGRGLPTFATVSPTGGLSAPLTEAGVVTVATAEFLAVTVLQQSIRPGHPVIFTTLPTFIDPRQGEYVSGAVENAKMVMMLAQMARFYRVPSGACVGLTNAHENDAQSGFETALAAGAALAGGLNMFSMAGLLDALTSFDYRKLLIDHDIAMMLKSLRKKAPVDAESIAGPLMAEVGPKGNFMVRKHTVARLRSCAFMSDLAFRDNRKTWLTKGRPSLEQKALDRALAVLDTYPEREPAVGWTEEVEAAIRDRFPGLFDGRVRIPEAWRAL